MGTRTKNILKYLFLPKYHYAEMTKKDKWWLTALIYWLTGYYLAYQWRKYRDMPDNFTHRFLVSRDLRKMTIDEILSELAMARQIHDLTYIAMIDEELQSRSVSDYMYINEIEETLKDLKEPDLLRLKNVWDMTNKDSLTTFEMAIYNAIENEVDKRVPF